MKRTSLTANSLGAELHINVEGSEDDLGSFVGHEFWHRFVPGAAVEVSELRRDWDLSISIDPKAGWLFDPAARVLTCPPRNILDAISTAGYMLEARRQTLGLYTLHGNIIANHNNTVALLGPISGIGKTGLSSYAADKGWWWISDEKFVMNEQGEHAGSVRGILQDVKTRRSAGHNGPNETEPYSRKIAAFVIPIVTDSKSLVHHTYDREKAFWLLNVGMAEDIRMTPSVLSGPEVPLPSFDSEDLAIRRRRVAVALSGLVPCLFVIGNSETILGYLSGLTRSRA